MPSLTTWAAFCPCGQCYPRDQNKHKAAPVKVTRQQTTREPSGTFATLQLRGRNLPPILPPQPTHTRRNSPPPEPSKTFCANLRQHTPEPSKIFRSLPELAPRTGPTPFYAGTLRNLPEPASRTYTSIRRNSPEPSGTCLRNLHQHKPELSGTFRNLPHAGTLRNLPEPASGTYTSICRNFQEPSGTPCGTYSSTPQNPLEPSGTFLRNLLLRPAPAHTGAYLG